MKFLTDLFKDNSMITMRTMLKATFRCIKHLLVNPNAKSGVNSYFAFSMGKKLDPLNSDFAFKMRKKPDPLKTSILQPLRDANYLGPSRLQD